MENQSKEKLISDLKWVFISNTSISLTQAIRELNERAEVTVTREFFEFAIKELLFAGFIVQDTENANIYRQKSS